MMEHKNYVQHKTEMLNYKFKFYETDSSKMLYKCEKKKTFKHISDVNYSRISVQFFKFT
jgi:hypothetical protein